MGTSNSKCCIEIGYRVLNIDLNQWHFFAIVQTLIISMLIAPINATAKRRAREKTYHGAEVIWRNRCCPKMGKSSEKALNACSSLIMLD